MQVCGSNGKVAEQEKFLFYRGVGNFDLPLSVKFQNGQVTLRNSGKEQIARAIIFESHNGKIGYRAIDNLTGEVITERLALDSNIDAVIFELKQALVTSGLYEKEAEAMIKTWRNSWFEDGMRVFYLLPRTNTDMVLPLTIQPTPTQVVRVLVGQTEVITPEMEKSVKEQVSRLNDPSPAVRADVAASIKKYGRFSEPILKRILSDESDPTRRAFLEQQLRRLHPRLRVKAVDHAIADERGLARLAGTRSRFVAIGVNSRAARRLALAKSNVCVPTSGYG